MGEESELSVPPRIGAPAVEEIVTAPLNRDGVALVRGESVRVDAVVRTRNVGHFFPGGTVDAFDVWLELQAVDDRGRVLFWNGFVEDDGKGPVEPAAHFYQSFQLDGRGNKINKRNAWSTRSVLYVSLIPPGAANTVRFRLNVPEDAGEKVTLKAKLNYRKFAWWNTQWAYAGVRDPAQGPVRDDEGLRRRALGLHRRHEQGLGGAEGDPRPSHRDHGGVGGDSPRRRFAGRGLRISPRPTRESPRFDGTTTESGSFSRATFAARSARSPG